MLCKHGRHLPEQGSMFVWCWHTITLNPPPPHHHPQHAQQRPKYSTRAICVWSGFFHQSFFILLNHVNLPGEGDSTLIEYWKGSDSGRRAEIIISNRCIMGRLLKRETSGEHKQYQQGAPRISVHQHSLAIRAKCLPRTKTSSTSASACKYHDIT